MEGQHHVMDRPVDVVIAVHRGWQKSIGSHQSRGICRIWASRRIGERGFDWLIYWNAACHLLTLQKKDLNCFHEVWNCRSLPTEVYQLLRKLVNEFSKYLQCNIVIDVWRHPVAEKHNQSKQLPWYETRWGGLRGAFKLTEEMYTMCLTGVCASRTDKS